MRNRLVVLTLMGLIAACGDVPTEPTALAPDAAPELSLVTTANQAILDGIHNHACAFYPADGNVNCWTTKNGTNPFGEAADYLNGDALGFAVGNGATCVLLADGGTHCWGDKAADIAYDPATFSGDGAVAVRLGQTAETCVLTEAGNVNCYGAFTTQQSWPFQPDGWQTMYGGGDAQWIEMTAWAVCWGTTSGDVACAGGDLNRGTWTPAVNSVVKNQTLTSNGGGYYPMCLLTTGGDVECNGNGFNEVGQAMGYDGGDGIATDGAWGRGCVLTSAGDIDCWGSNTAANQRWTATSNTGAVGIVTVHSDLCWVTGSNEIDCLSSTPDAYTPPVTDTDGDGVLDDDDAFPNSDLSSTVTIGGCDSGVENHVLAGGASFMDLIGAAADAARNHGQFVNAVTRLADGWKKDGLISGRDKGSITSCAARSK